MSFPLKSGRWRVIGHRGAVALAAAAIAVGASAWLGVGYVHYARLAAAQQEAVRHAESANADLQDALAQLRDRLGVATEALNSTQHRIAAVSDEARRKIAVSERAATSTADRVAQLKHALDDAQHELHLTEAQRVTLLARLSKAETDLAAGQARQQQAQAGLDAWQRKLEEVAAERDKAAGDRDRMRARVGQLEQRLSMLQSRQPARPVAEAQPAPAVRARPAPAIAAAAPTPPRAAAPAVAAAAPARVVTAPMVAAVAAPPAVQAEERPRTPAVAVEPGRLGQFERVLASAGVDVAHLFAQYGMRTGVGGPFVPVPRGGVPTLSAQKLASLERLVKTLPIDAPLSHYRLGSPFGLRGDPMNRRREFHTGIDMDAPYMTPVYSTAPGVVSYAGYRDDYGKVVEIDHGHGISTRYAHLHRYIVSVGQHVAAHTQIGFLGSTGRATGPHLHYEVLVAGEPQDPEKFLGLARLVPVAAR